MPKIAIVRLVAAALVLASFSGFAGAAELRVMSATEMQAALQELAPTFEKKSGTS